MHSLSFYNTFRKLLLLISHWPNLVTWPYHTWLQTEAGACVVFIRGEEHMSSQILGILCLREKRKVDICDS